VIIYTVKRGDSIYSIARRYGLNPNKIINDNGLTRPNELVVGQNLVLLSNKFTYMVKDGDTLGDIAVMFDTTVEELQRFNPTVVNPDNIYSGLQINLPSISATGKSIDVNGYALTSISDEILRKTLPYLTYISIFSYMVTRDGELMWVDDERIIQTSLQFGVAPLMVITNFEEGNGFSSDIANSILVDEAKQDILINNILNVLNQKGYYGLNIDFEYILPEDRELYNNFLRKITDVMHSNGYIVTTAIAPKISDDQQGLLYEAHDYQAHGEIVDKVIIMTYEWGYTYGPPLAVAPIGPVREVLEYAVTRIPSEKILMGMPNYGYDWKLPFVQGETVARTLTLNGAIDLARDVYVEIVNDPDSLSATFEYEQDGFSHVVWFDDALSITKRLLLVDELNLGGVSYWTINSFFQPNWNIVNYLFNINKVV